MIDKLEAIKARFDQVGVALTNPEIIANQKEFGRLSKEYKSKTLPINVSSAFTWHPNSRHLAAVVDRCVSLIDVNSGQVTPLTAPCDPPPRPEACVVSPDGKKIAFVKQVNGFNQIFVVDVESEALK